MKKFFTLTEVLVGAVILSLILAGLISAFVAAKKYISHSNKRLIAFNLARGKLNELYQAVREDTWGSGDLSVGTHTLAGVTIEGVNYTGSYTVIPKRGREYRQVVITIQYPKD
ncbi:MAG: type II secretion system protein [Candidatus Omnitrophica bacterium]|nr:type II secretion system protein [Candidatus Omnitrophota bacterium]